MDNSDIIKSVAVESICNSATLFLTFTAFFLVVLLMYRHSSNENRNRRGEFYDFFLFYIMSISQW